MRKKTFEHVSIIAIIVWAVITSGYFLLFNWILKQHFDFGLKPFFWSFLSFVFFSVGVLKCIPVVEKELKLEKTKINTDTDFFIALCLFLWIFLINSVFILMALKKYWEYDFIQGLNFFYRNHTDSPHYFDIAESWYQNTSNDRKFDIVFFPLFPMLMRIISQVLRVKNLPLISIVLNSIFSFAAGISFYKLAKIYIPREQARNALKYLFIMPPAFFFFWPMTESLFLLLTVLFFYFLSKKDYIFVILIAFLASLTRSQGILLFAPSAFSFIADLRNAYLKRSYNIKEHVLSFLAIVAPLAGFLIYLSVNNKVYGNPFQFLIFQKDHWNQRLDFFWNTAKYIPEYISSRFFEDNTREINALFIPVFISFWATLGLICYGVKKLPFVQTLYSFGYFLMSFGATWLLSGPRYATVLFPLFISLSFLTKNKKFDYILTFILILCYFIYMDMFLKSYPVY